MSMKEIWARERNQKVCAIDIDGVLNNYPKCWVDFINKVDGKKYKDLNDLKKKTSYYHYKKVKIVYRTCGEKRSLPVVKNASELTKVLHKHNFKVILLSSRPYRLHREIYNDTVYWLEKNKIEFDGFVWGKEKHWEVLKEFPYLKFLIDDNRVIVNQVAKLGYRVYLLDNQYNKGDLEPTAHRIFGLKELINTIKAGDYD